MLETSQLWKGSIYLGIHRRKLNLRELVICSEWWVISFCTWCLPRHICLQSPVPRFLLSELQPSKHKPVHSVLYLSYCLLRFSMLFWVEIVFCFAITFFTSNSFPRILSSKGLQKGSLRKMTDAKTHLFSILTLCSSTSSEQVPLLFGFLEGELILIQMVCRTGRWLQTL